MHPLISVAEAARLLQGEVDVCLLDCRFDLAAPSAGELAFRDAHIPGARHAHLERDLSGPPGPTGAGRHPLPSALAWQERLERWGVGPDTRVLVYDDTGGCFAARAWWLFRYFGHEQVAVLDGGWQAWLAMGGDRASAEADANFTPEGARAPVTGGREPVSPAAAVEGAGGRPGASAGQPLEGAVGLVTLSALGEKLLVDARDPARYAGVTEPIDPRAGHIPGAINRFWKLNLDANGLFLPVEELRAAWLDLLGSAAPGDVVCYCGSGVTACHNLLALEHCGIKGVCLYPGSFSEYCSDPARPVATGAEPGPRASG